MNEILEHTYFDNSLLTWLTTFGIFLASVLLGKVAYWIFSKIVRTFTGKTKTRLDDIIVDMIKDPMVFLLMASGIWIGLELLTLPTGVEAAIGNSYKVIIALLIGWMLSRLFDAIYEEYLKPWADQSENDLDDQLLPIIRKAVKITIWSMAIIIGLSNAGYNVGALIAGLGIGGLAMAMAAKDTVSNIFGGFTIFTDQPFKLGDRIKVSGYDGSVSEIGVRSTRLVTLEGRTVTIPNAKFADAPVENVSSEANRKVALNLGLTYDTQPSQMQKAMDILADIREKEPDTEENTTIAFSGFGDFALNLTFIYYVTKGADIAATQTRINMEILSRFNQEGLAFAFPTQTIFHQGV